MKKTFSIILYLSIINLFSFPALGQSLQVPFNVNDQFYLNSNILERAISNPYSLQIWKPPPPEAPYLPNKTNIEDVTTSTDSNFPISTFSGHSGLSAGVITAIVLGTSLPILFEGGLLALSIKKSGGSILLPVKNSSRPGDTTYCFNYGEEIMYNLVFKNSEETPIYPDTVMYIKVPSWLEYKVESTNINNTKLTDEADDDVVTYFSNDSLLVINLGNIDPGDGIVITFNAKVLTQTVSMQEAFCLVKLQSISQKFESDWRPLSIFQDRQLPPKLERIFETHKGIK